MAVIYVIYDMTLEIIEVKEIESLKVAVTIILKSELVLDFWGRVWVTKYGHLDMLKRID